MIVGIALIPYLTETSRLLSVSSLPTLTFPSYSPASASMVGVSM